MSEPLSRQQIEHLAVSLKEETPWKHQVNYWLETDATLREQLAAMTADREAVEVMTNRIVAIEQKLRTRYPKLDVLSSMHLEFIDHATTLLLYDLAVVTAERDEALGCLGYPVPASTPTPRYKCGLCEAKGQQLAFARRDTLLDTANEVQRSYLGQAHTSPNMTEIVEAFVEFLREEAKREAGNSSEFPNSSIAQQREAQP